MMIAMDAGVLIALAVVIVQDVRLAENDTR